MSDIGWLHPKDESDEWDGSNDAGMEWFQGDSVTNFAREGVQNSLDAMQEGADKVVVKLNINKVDVDTIPNIAELKENLHLAFNSFLREFGEDGDQRPVTFYNRAIKVLDQPKISVFEFSDYNTTGMWWIKDIRKSPFYIYMKAKGITGKSSDESGSFGIGKNAPYVVSDLRTIFSSTVYKGEDGVLHQAIQGKSILSSIIDNQGVQRRGNGYWGVRENCQPVYDSEVVFPQWIQRANLDKLTLNDLGTKISVLGFSSNQNRMWEERIVSAIIRNFFAAIDSGKLEVHISNKYILNHRSLLPTIKDHTFRARVQEIEGSSGITSLNLRASYLSTLKDDNVIVRNKKLVYLGECRLKIKVEENLPKKVCFIRNGMFITDDLKAPGISSFSGLKDFVAVFDCVNKKGNKLLRLMENPSHTNFDPDRPYEYEDKIKAKNAITELGKWIREELKLHAKEKITKVRDIKELLEFFSYQDQDQDSDSAEEEEDPFSGILDIEEVVEIKPRQKIVPGKGKDDVPPDVPPTPLDVPPTPPNVPPTPPVVVKKLKKCTLENFRFIKKDRKIFRLFFTSTHTGEVNLFVYASGEDIEKRLKVGKLNQEELTNNICKVNVVSNNRCEVEVELESDFHGALEVVAYEV